MTRARVVSSRRSREDRLPARLWGRTVPELWSDLLRENRVQLVVPGTPSSLEPDSVYLLCDFRHGIDLDIARVLEAYRRLGCEFAWIRLRPRHRSQYRERYVTDETSGRLVRVERHYNSPRFRSYRLAMTKSIDIARLWQQSLPFKDFQNAIAGQTNSVRGVLRTSGEPYDLSVDEDVTRFVVGLLHRWKNPSATFPTVQSNRPGVWSEDPDAVAPGARVAGDVWVGIERTVSENECVVGPAVLWDRVSNDEKRSVVASNPSSVTTSTRDRSGRNRRRPMKRNPKPIYEACKRGFDIAFALVAIALTLPFYPIIAILIYLEDGRPIFFGHRRETKGGRPFDCLKFRSMRRDAEEVRRRILEQNMCDGPQFFIDRDPRLTRVGRILRDVQVDEWPQFFHVLTGKMSVVGPRPLPKPENQYCPAWREARLSVRPGITGLWQVKRRRLPGLDFQEWIRYDIEYVENRSMEMDLWIIILSVMMLFRLGWMVLARRFSMQANPSTARVPRTV
jgi:lipopolysaccharide/colanic/teichoic acid biosynthesis glycosyltransferase